MRRRGRHSCCLLFTTGVMQGRRRLPVPSTPGGCALPLRDPWRRGPTLRPPATAHLRALLGQPTAWTSPRGGLLSLQFPTLISCSSPRSAAATRSPSSRWASCKPGAGDGPEEKKRK